MDLKTVFTKTAKGVTQVNQKTQSLSRDLMRVLKCVDGKSTIEQLAKQNDISVVTLDKALQQLKKDGFIKVFEVKLDVPQSDFGGSSQDDFDFTKPAKPTWPSDLVPTFGPSKYRSPLALDQVERATSAPTSPTPTPTPAIDETRLRAERAAAEAEALKAREQAARAQAEARARAEREAQLRARLEVEARARKEAEARALEEARRAQEAADRAHAELELKREDERKQQAVLSDTRARLTQEQVKHEEAQQQALALARAKAEAEAKAFAQARAQAEAAAKSLTAARADAEAASKRQQEEFALAQRNLREQLKAEIEAKVRAEMEQLLKADINENAREEVEAAVRQEAQEEAQRQLEEKLVAERVSIARAEASAKERAEVDVKRMLAEQEARMRAEMDERLAQLTAEKRLAEEETRRMAEAQVLAAAKAADELAARLKAEEAARQVAEAEAARVKKAEVAAAAAAALMAEKLKAEEDARRAMALDAEHRSRMEAQSRARLDAQMAERLAAEKEAKMQAEARALIEQEMRETAEKVSSAKLKGAELARAEAEKKAAMEARARELAARSAAEEIEERKRVERESEIALRRERDLREKAEEKARLEEEAEERARAAQVARLKELQEDSARAAEERGSEVRTKRRRTGGGSGAFRWIVMAGFIALGLGLGIVQLVPLGGIGSRLVAALSGWLHDDVAVGSSRIGLLPKPHVKFDQVSVGKSLDAQATDGRLFMNMGSLFGDKFEVNTLELSKIKISADALNRALRWAETDGRGKDIRIGRISLRDVTAEIRGVDLGAFDADIDYDKSGNMQRVSASTKTGKWSFDAEPDKSAVSATSEMPWTIEFRARNMVLPIGAPMNVVELKAKGTIAGKELSLPAIEARMMGGTATGQLRADWKQHLVLQADITSSHINLEELASVFTRDITLSGKMNGTFNVNATASTLGALLDRPQVRGTFEVKDGALSNADLVQAMRSSDSAGRGGQTKFGELTGQLRAGDGLVRFEQVKLAGGVLLANGNITVNNGSGTLAGNVGAEIRSTVAQDRASFGVSGTVARPILKRGG